MTESVLLYGCTTWTQTKRFEKKLDKIYSIMTWPILNKSWKPLTFSFLRITFQICEHPLDEDFFHHNKPFTFKRIQYVSLFFVVFVFHFSLAVNTLNNPTSPTSFHNYTPSLLTWFLLLASSLNMVSRIFPGLSSFSSDFRFFSINSCFSFFEFYFYSSPTSSSSSFTLFLFIIHSPSLHHSHFLFSSFTLLLFLIHSPSLFHSLTFSSFFTLFLYSSFSLLFFIIHYPSLRQLVPFASLLPLLLFIIHTPSLFIIHFLSHHQLLSFYS